MTWWTGVSSEWQAALVAEFQRRLDADQIPYFVGKARYRGGLVFRCQVKGQDRRARQARTEAFEQCSIHEQLLCLEMFEEQPSFPAVRHAFAFLVALLLTRWRPPGGTLRGGAPSDDEARKVPNHPPLVRQVSRQVLAALALGMLVLRPEGEMPEHVRVLISYSHDSDAHRERIRDLAGRLRGDGIDAWIDQFSPVPTEGWPRWMEREFARANFILVACTEPYAEQFSRPPGIGSGVGWEAVLVRQELYDCGGNSRFVPVHFDGDDRVVPLILRPYPRYRLPTDYQALVRHLVGQLGAEALPLGPQPTFEGARPGPSATRAAIKLWNVPQLPEQHLPREELDAFKVSLIARGPNAVAVAGQHQRLGVQGMPGVGKTVLAAALAADTDIHEAFPGGVFWLTLGRTPDDVVVWQGKLAAAVAGHPVEIRTAREGKTTLGELFAASSPSLLILDDVWSVEDADPFDTLTQPSRLLITTRNREVAKGLGAAVRELHELRASDALRMLAAYAGRRVDALPEVASGIVRECGELPLAVAMAGAMLQDRPDAQWPILLGQLAKADLGYLEVALPQYRQHRTMLAAIEVSAQELPEDIRNHYLDFAVFAGDAAVPEQVLQRLWATDGVELAAAQRTVNKLVDRSLVRRDAKGRLTLHDLQHDYVRARAGDLAPRHARLVETYRNAAPAKTLHAVEGDGYFFESIARHVRDGNGEAALRALLLDHRWLAAKLMATEPNALLADFNLLSLASDEPLRLLHDALRLSGHVLSQRLEELPSQLLGRLRSSSEPELRHLCARVEADVGGPSLLPLWQSLIPPGGPLLRTFQGHADWVNAVVLSADGKTAVSGSDDGTLKVWDVDTGEEQRTLHGHASGVTALVLSADGKTVVSGSDDGTLKAWDVETGEERWMLQGHAGSVNAVALSADGKTVVSGSNDATVKVWDREAGEERFTLQGHTGWVNAVALSADGKTVVSGSNDAMVRVWDMEAGEERFTLQGHTGWVNAVALSADGKTAVSGSNDGTLKVWDVQAGEERCTLCGHTSVVNAVALSTDRKTAISGSNDGTLEVWDVEAGRERRTLRGHTGWVTAVALSADGKTAVSGSSDRTLKVWGVETGEEHRTFHGHASGLTGVVLSADGKTGISGSSDGTLKVWDVEAGEERRKFQGHTDWVNAVALSADGKTGISGSSDGTLKVWDVESGEERRTLRGHAGSVTAVALSADGKTAVSGSSDQTLKVWDVETGEERRTFCGHTGWVTVVALSADGAKAASGSDDATLKVWDVEAGEERRTLRGHTSSVNAVALSADGATAVSGSSDRTLKVWDVEAGEERRTLQGHTGWVTAVALSVDGAMAVSSSNDRTLKVWNVGMGACLASFTGDVPFSAVALSRAMRVLAGDSIGSTHLLAFRFTRRLT